MAQQRLYEAEADVVVKHWEKRNADTALYETHQELESQRLQLQQANQWADQAQRDQISLHGDLELRSKLQSSFLVRQFKIDELLSVHPKRRIQLL